jgi:hypothetical protein
VFKNSKRNKEIFALQKVLENKRACHKIGKFNLIIRENEQTKTAVPVNKETNC